MEVSIAEEASETGDKLLSIGWSELMGDRFMGADAE